MAGPDYGALGLTFQSVRILQSLCMVAVIGLSSNFISEIVTANQTAPNVLIGTLSVVCVAVIYCAITYILYIDDILPFLINTGMDFLLLIAVIVVAVTVGKPLSYLNCQAIGSAGDSSSAYDFASALGSNLDLNGGSLDFDSWIGATKPNCLEMKSIWGLSIALCILFAFSSVCSVVLWKRKPVLAGTKLDLES